MLFRSGDAAHAIVPFFGQGANCALEDCIEIDRCLDTSNGDWRAALASYERARKANCDTIAALALENFTEMSDKVNSPLFRAKSAAMRALERRVPNFVSRYELVSFSTLPYAEIPARMRKQNLVLGSAALAAALGVARGIRRGNGSPRGRGKQA